MTFTLTIKLGNTAIQSGADISLLLEKYLGPITFDMTEGKIKDDNGNTVGSWKTK
jgi:hypothetical protein